MLIPFGIQIYIYIYTHHTLGYMDLLGCAAMELCAADPTAGSCRTSQTHANTCTLCVCVYAHTYFDLCLFNDLWAHRRFGFSGLWVGGFRLVFT